MREAATGGAGVRRVTTMVKDRARKVHQAEYMRDCESRRELAREGHPKERESGVDRDNTMFDWHTRRP